MATRIDTLNVNEEMASAGAFQTAVGPVKRDERYYVFAIWPEFNTGGDPVVTRAFPESQFEQQFGALRTIFRNFGMEVEPVEDAPKTWVLIGADGHRGRLELAAAHA